MLFLALTAANMLVLSIAAFLSHRNATAGRPVPSRRTLLSAQLYFDVAHVLKYLSMLDVFILGSYIFVTTMTGSFEMLGLKVALHRGLACLLAAEVIHHCQYYVVTSTEKQCAKKTGRAKMHGGNMYNFDLIKVALQQEQPVRCG